MQIPRAQFLLVSSLALVAALTAGCKETADPGTTATTPTTEAPATPTAAPADPAGAPASAPASAPAADARCAEPAKLRAEALASGKKLFGGVKLASSTPIGDVLGKAAELEGKVVQIEGKVLGLCPGAGCWALLKDASGKELRLKVDDGTLDFRVESAVGRYMVGEGVFNQEGHHGSQVFIGKHGAVTGSVACP